MKKILLVKTSSLGDVIHTLPALTDAARAYPGIQFDWVVEKSFAEIPAWHSSVDRVIPVSLRAWRKAPWRAIRSGEISAFLKALRAERYDHVLDAQGLLKSALVSVCAKGERLGLDFRSAREPLPSLFYHRRFKVEWKQHAIPRVRQLFAQALGYPVPTTTPEYGICHPERSEGSPEQGSAIRQEILRRFAPQDDSDLNYLVFLHGTTWDTKHWPEQYWIALARLFASQGHTILVPWGNAAERTRAERIASMPNVHVLPKSTLQELAHILAHAQAVVAVDTGLGHLATALDVPTFSMYGPTDPKHIGTQGAKAHHLTAHFECAPCWKKMCTYRGTSEVQPACFAQITPEKVFAAVSEIL